MSDTTQPKRTRRTKAQIAADNLAAETAKATAAATELTKEANDGATIKGRTVAAILATLNGAWHDIENRREFTILVKRSDVAVGAFITIEKPITYGLEVGLEVTPSLL